jgi:hypothetical protein
MNKTMLLGLAGMIAVAGLLVVLLKSRVSRPGVAVYEPPAGEASVVAEVPAFLALLTDDPAQSARAVRRIQQGWHPGSTIMLFETARLARSQEVLEQVVWLAETQTGQQFGTDLASWSRWVWTSEYQPHPSYAEFKGELYSVIDPRFREYFRDTEDARIRLDEIVWGGVRRDGIPPLQEPAMVAADQADWLDDQHVVFGVVHGGEARAYPQRILAWHEMFKDSIGGQPLCGVY